MIISLPKHVMKIFIFVVILEPLFMCNAYAAQVNKSHHLRREPNNGYINKNQNAPAYRSFQPATIKYHRVYPKTEEHDYGITSYDAEYDEVVSNFTSSVYDDNPPLYPNPEAVVAGDNSQANIKSMIDNRVPISGEMELPDDSLADADLKEHNIIDSVTYLYGFNSCHGVRTEWMVLIYITGFISIVLVGFAVLWLIWSEYAQEFRTYSKLYPISINLGCCLEACTLIYMQAIMGVSSPSYCEKIALLLHYTYLVCSIWIILLAASITEYSQSNTVMSLKYNYLIAYGIPAIYVMFNYAISLERYEIKHYCWMSIEKGMVLGFMAPAMLLILLNTALVIAGLRSVNERRAQLLAVAIQGLVGRHMVAGWGELGAAGEHGGAGDAAQGDVDDVLDNVYSPGSSRKNTDSSDTLERECNLSEDECHYISLGNETVTAEKLAERGMLSALYADDVSWRSWSGETNGLKSYLNLCLVLEPFFAINWVMGVVAVENASHWSTPTIYLILVTCMHAYLVATLSMTLPILRSSKDEDSCCEDVVAEPTLTRVRTTDSIPLLDPCVQQPAITPAPADTISTISI